VTNLHKEQHNTSRLRWLRAVSLGVNGGVGVVSVSSVVVGVAAANGVTSGTIVLAGVAALVAGATLKAAGEFVSVQSQAATKPPDLAREIRELREHPDLELQELAGIYITRGLEPVLTLQVACQLMTVDALGVHALEELGITEK
jgi:VIT1/CCC1 family predicted Fe2+/Mn2+ transporter